MFIILFLAVPAMDLDSLYSDYDQDFYAAASPHKNDSRDKMVSLEVVAHHFETCFPPVGWNESEYTWNVCHCLNCYTSSG
jgi:hypothetical protein